MDLEPHGRAMKLAIVVVVIAIARVAVAYPQYQLSYEPTCSGCHLSPAGGGLLGENGLMVAESTSTFGGAPEAAHGALVGPSWLVLGGDFRGGAGLNQNVGLHPAAFPMQAELAAAARKSTFTLYATLGAQMGDGNRPLTFVQAREHYLMWQSELGPEALFVRAGRFMPVYGLRFAEHNDSVRRWGQTPLYGETYGLAVEYITADWEAHATGFVHDPLQDPIEPGDGAAAYAEKRFAERASIGIEGRYAHSPVDARTAGGITAKYWLPSVKVLLEAEGQVVHQSFAAGSQRNQIVSYLLGSWFVHVGWLLDVGISQYDEDIAVKTLDTEAIDVNLHWFATSHWELLLTNRLETIAFGSGGPTSGYTLFQIHYRL
jgi:hypothetical protein